VHTNDAFRVEHSRYSTPVSVGPETID